MNDSDPVANTSDDRKVPLTVTITRDENAAGGYQLAVVEENVPGDGDEQRNAFAAIGDVDPNGPAARAGMGAEHIAWRVTHVDGVYVTAETVHAEVDKTRSPNYTFTMTIRGPVTGELTFTDASDRSTYRVHVDPRDIRMHVQTLEDGQQRLNLSVPETYRQRAGPDAMRRLQSRMQSYLEELGALRKELSPEEKAKLEEEEAAAAALDKPAANADTECVACRDSERAMVLFPCRHLATCHKCTVIVRRKTSCPICRVNIEDAKNISEVDTTVTEVYVC